ncbi:MAG: hypothetical protein Q6363_009740 [Candidatus Njordarchaeota archaeon]
MNNFMNMPELKKMKKEILEITKDKPLSELLGDVIDTLPDDIRNEIQEIDKILKKRKQILSNLLKMLP